MKFSYYIWALYLIVFPFYVFPEGNPQMADLFGVVLIFTNIRSILLNVTANKFTKYLFLFVIYTFIVNTIWMIYLRSYEPIITSINYLYCFLLLLFFVDKIKERTFLKFTLHAIALSLCIQLTLLPFTPIKGFRMQLFFNNPNQLALWGLCLIMIANIIASILKDVKFIYLFSISVLCTFFIMLSASRSASVSVLLFWVFFFIKSKKQLLLFSAGSIIILSFLILSQKIDIANFKQLNYITERITGETNSMPSPSGEIGRGYDRLFQFPQYLFFGAGEGEVERFNSPIELHSTFASILFSYGIVGFLFFAIAIATFLKKIYREIIVLLIIIGIYATVHMSLRIPFLWITLLFIYHLYETKIAKTNPILLNN
ncbi:hypothetical protein [Lacinutrix undariae]